MKRRNLLKSAAGIMFCGCGLKHAAEAATATRDQAPAHHKLPVIVGGKRVRSIDVHAHCFFPAAFMALDGKIDSHIPKTKGAHDFLLTAEDAQAMARRMAQMDAMGIDTEVLSVNPFWYGTPRELSQKIVRINNEAMAALTHAHPDRFAGFCSLSLQFPDLAVQELEDAIKVKGLKGAAIGAHVAGLDFADPKFDPVWAKAEALDAALFIHPASTPQLNKRFQGNGWLSNVIGNPLDTSIALEHLIFQGTLDKFPKLKVIAAHGGGYLPSYAERMDYGCYVSPANCDPAIRLKKQPTEYLRQMYYDVLVFSPEALRHLIAEVGVSQLMLGTDHPIPWNEHPIDRMFEGHLLNDRQRRAIIHENAARVLRI
ncbi:MAG TPA: amidohydrolase family protein [Stellaceae bacterium]|nr:amidohydrolase family protein [Stellaceae bacterium]